MPRSVTTKRVSAAKSAARPTTPVAKRVVKTATASAVRAPAASRARTTTMPTRRHSTVARRAADAPRGAAVASRTARGAEKARPAPRATTRVRTAVTAAPPPIDAAVEALVAWAIEEGLRTGDLDDLVLDAHLDLARRDHVPEHIKISGQRDAACEAEEEKAYDAALAVNLSVFTRQFRFLVERIATTPPVAAKGGSYPVDTVRGWVERYRAG